MKPKKKIFVVEEGETLSECLARMDQEGYFPSRRMEKPFFKESKQGPVYAGQSIQFEGELKENPND